MGRVSTSRVIWKCLLGLMAAGLACRSLLCGAVFRPDPPWPDGVVPFEFDVNVSLVQENIARAAMDRWSEVGNITFRPRVFSDAAWVHFRSSDDDLIKANYVGTIGLDGIGYALGQRKVNIAQWEEFVVVHELGHVLGLVHEQNRADRDEFIRIEWDNVEAGLLQFNYWIDPLSRTYGSYDFDSIMQYGACAAALCAEDCDPTDEDCRAITVLPPNEDWQTEIGRGDRLSRMDRLIISFLYPRSSWRFVQPGGDAGSGTFLSPFDSLGVSAGDVPAGGTLWLIHPGQYTFRGTISKNMTLRAPLGGAVIR